MTVLRNREKKHHRKKLKADDSAFFHYPDFTIEQELIKDRCGLIAGIDEAGRGALAGPLAVGIVVYPADVIMDAGELAGTIDDSKKLTPARREMCCRLIIEKAHYSDVCMVSHRTVDEKNVNAATAFAIGKLLEKFPFRPDVLLVDGNYSFHFGIKYVPVKKGDARSISIASASIMAKVARDRLMDRLDEKYPGYGFKQNRGYGTRDHREKIMSMGHSPVHRKTYDPLRSILSGQTELFKQ